MNNLAKTLGYSFSRQSVLKDALARSTKEHERLEFLGDSVLGLVVSEKLMLCHNLDEGEMTRARSSLVSEQSLYEAALAIGLDRHIRTVDGNAPSRSAIADSLEAVFGAVYIDGGLDRAREVILKTLNAQFSKPIQHLVSSDFKSRLQELIQAKGLPTPTYSLVCERGPDHTKVFEMAVIAGKIVGRGTGRSKSLASQEAAKNALEALIGG